MHDDAIDESSLSLAYEEGLLRSALHLAVANGKTGQIGPLVQAQATLRATSLKMESHVVFDKRKLYAPLAELLKFIHSHCRKRGIKYGTKNNLRALRRIIDDERNREGEPLQVADRKRKL